MEVPVRGRSRACVHWAYSLSSRKKKQNESTGRWRSGGSRSYLDLVAWDTFRGQSLMDNGLDVSEPALFGWQEGYGAFSIGVSGVEATIRYIRNQAEHHRKRTFREELRTMLRKLV